MNFSSARPTIPGRPGLHKPAANQGLAFGKALEEAEIHWLVACVIKRVACLGSRSRMASRWKWLLCDIRWMHETYVLIVYSLVLGKSIIMSVVSIQITLRSWPHGEQWYATMDSTIRFPNNDFPIKTLISVSNRITIHIVHHITCLFSFLDATALVNVEQIVLIYTLYTWLGITCSLNLSFWSNLLVVHFRHVHYCLRL